MANEVSEVLKVGTWISAKIAFEATLPDEEYSGVIKSLLAGNMAKAVANLGDNSSAVQGTSNTTNTASTAKPI
jgi:hypothetical protein